MIWVRYFDLYTMEVEEIGVYGVYYLDMMLKDRDIKVVRVFPGWSRK